MAQRPRAWRCRCAFPASCHRGATAAKKPRRRRICVANRHMHRCHDGGTCALYRPVRLRAAVLEHTTMIDDTLLDRALVRLDQAARHLAIDADVIEKLKYPRET